MVKRQEVCFGDNLKEWAGGRVCGRSFSESNKQCITPIQSLSEDGSNEGSERFNLAHDE